MSIRPAIIEDAAGIAKVHIDTWRIAYRDIVPQSYLNEMNYKDRQ